MRIDRVKLAAAIAVADIRLGALAGRSGVSCATITAIRSGKSCSESTAVKLAAGLGVTVAEIVRQ